MEEDKNKDTIAENETQGLSIPVKEAPPSDSEDNSQEVIANSEPVVNAVEPPPEAMSEQKPETSIDKSDMPKSSQEDLNAEDISKIQNSKPEITPVTHNEMSDNAQKITPNTPVGQGPATKQVPNHAFDDGTSNDLKGPAVVGVAASQMRKKSPHRNNKKFAVIMTIVVALVASAIVIYVYFSTNNNATQISPSSSTGSSAESQENTEQEVVVPATETDVDQTVEEVDQIINELDDEVDFAEDELSDSVLGL